MKIYEFGKHDYEGDNIMIITENKQQCIDSVKDAQESYEDYPEDIVQLYLKIWEDGMVIHQTSIQDDWIDDFIKECLNE